jgi:hypothetical protein
MQACVVISLLNLPVSREHYKYPRILVIVCNVKGSRNV